MVSRKTLILSVAIAVVVTVPAVAWAVGGPLGADPQPTTTTGNADPGAPYGWMGQMHDYMWNNGDLPEDFPADAADWMNQMHDYVWGSGRASAQVDPTVGGSSSQSVPSGSNSQGAGSTRPGPGPGWAGAGCGVAGSHPIPPRGT